MLWNDYLDWCRTWLAECYRVLTDDGRICLNVGIDNLDPITTERRHPFADFVYLMKDVGLQNRGSKVWFDNTRSSLTAWGSWASCSAPFIYTAHEIVIIGYKKEWKLMRDGISDITPEEFKDWIVQDWFIRPESIDRKICPAPFPEELPKRCIKLLSYQGDVVLDPFAGRGTSGFVAMKTKRNFIGFEIDEITYKYAEKNIRKIERNYLL